MRAFSGKLLIVTENTEYMVIIFYASIYNGISLLILNPHELTRWPWISRGNATSGRSCYGIIFPTTTAVLEELACALSRASLNQVRCHFERLLNFQNVNNRLGDTFWSDSRLDRKVRQIA